MIRFLLVSCLGKILRKISMLDIRLFCVLMEYRVNTFLDMLL